MAISFEFVSNRILSKEDSDAAMALETSINSFLLKNYRKGSAVYIRGINFKNEAVENYIKASYERAGWDVQLRDVGGTTVMILKGKGKLVSYEWKIIP